MGIGREVADAYIEVHGDLSKFRNDLNSASSAFSEWAEDNADEFTEAMGKRIQSQWGRQWSSILDTIHSGTKVDFSRMIDNFDLNDLDAASEKIHNMLGEMQDAGKLTSEQFADVAKAIDTEIKARQNLMFVERDAANARARTAADAVRYADVQKQMMEGLAKAREDEANQAISDYARMQAAQENYNKSFEAMFRANRMSDMTKDFEGITRAMNDMDWSKLAKGFGDFDGLRDRVAEVTEQMRTLGRVSDDNAKRITDDVDAWISAETARQRLVQQGVDADNNATAEALKNARLIREAQDKYKASLAGMNEAARLNELNKGWRDLAEAMRTNDFSAISKGTKNMEELRDRITDVTLHARRMGWTISSDMDDIDVRLGSIGKNQSEYNLAWNATSAAVRKTSRDTDGLNKRMGVFSRLISNAGKKLEGLTGLNVLGDMLRQGVEFMQNIDRNAVKIGKMTLLVGSAVSSITSLVGGLAVVGQDLAAMGNIGILAPGFLTAVGIGVAVLVASFKDMKKVLGDLKPAFATLQDNISAKFWEQAEAPIRSLVTSMLPTLNTQLAITGTRMGALVGAASTAFKDAASAERMTVMFERMNSSLDILKGAMAPVVQALVTLGEVGSKYFERLATWLVTLSERFNTFIQAAAADGRLDAWIERAIEGFKSVGSIISSTISIFNAVGEAARMAGIGGLSDFATSIAGVAAVMQSPAFQSVLTMFFSGALQGFNEVKAGLAGLGPAIASIMPTISLALVSIGETVRTVIGYIGSIMSNPAIQQGITNFTNGINSAVTLLAPAITPIANSLGGVMNVLGDVAQIVSQVATAFLVNFAPTLDLVAEAFSRIAWPAGDAIVSIMNTLGPAFNDLITTVLPPLEEAFNMLLPIIVELVNTLGPVLMGAVEALAPLFTVLTAALMPVVEAIMQVVDAVAPFLIPAIEKIVAAISPVIAVLGEFVGFIMTILVPILVGLLIGAINNVVGVIEGLSNVFMGVVEIISAIITGFAAFFTKIFQGDIGGALTALGTMFGEIWNGIVKVISGAIEAAWNFIQLMFLGKLLSGIKTGLMNIGNFFKSTWDAVRNGVSSAFSAMQGIVSGGLSSIWGFVTGVLNGIRGFFVGAWNGMVAILQGAWSSMVSGVANGVSGVMGWVRGIPGMIGGALSGLGNLLVNAGSAIINGLLQGLKNAWGAVTSFVGGIADWIARNKGPLSYDKVLLEPAGNVIMEGLAKGLKDKLGHLRNTLDTVTDTMHDSIADSFARSKMYVAGVDAAMGLADGLKDKRSAVINALGSITPDTKLSANVRASGTAVRTAETAGPGGKIVNVHEGAIRVESKASDEGIVAAKVIDELAAFTSTF